MNQYDLTEWLICLSFSHMCFLKYETVWHTVSSVSQPRLCIHTRTPNKNQRRFFCPAAFKASLDRLGCSWNTFFHRSRGQIHLRGKRGEEERALACLDTCLQHPPPFSFLSSPDYACIIWAVPKTMELWAVVQLVTPPIPVGWYVVLSSKEWWKKEEKTLLPQTSSKSLPLKNNFVLSEWDLDRDLECKKFQ